VALSEKDPAGPATQADSSIIIGIPFPYLPQDPDNRAPAAMQRRRYLRLGLAGRPQRRNSLGIYRRRALAG
jgi:hypothetical protein